MDGVILAPLEPQYSRTLETGMTVTEPVVSRPALVQNAFP